MSAPAPGWKILPLEQRPHTGANGARHCTCGQYLFVVHCERDTECSTCKTIWRKDDATLEQERARRALGRHPIGNAQDAVNGCERAAKKAATQPEDERVSQETTEAIRHALRAAEHARNLARRDIDALFAAKGWDK